MKVLIHKEVGDNGQQVLQLLKTETVEVSPEIPATKNSKKVAAVTKQVEGIITRFDADQDYIGQKYTSAEHEFSTRESILTDPLHTELVEVQVDFSAELFNAVVENRAFYKDGSIIIT